MNIIDIVLAVIVIAAAVTGAMRGIVKQLGTILGLIFAVVGCRLFGASVADWIVSPGSAHVGLWRALVYIALFAAIFWGVSVLARMLTAMLSAVKLRILDRAGGAIFRVALWLLLTSLVLNVYLGVCPKDQPTFSNPAYPWRSAVVKFAPNLLGYLAN